MTDLLVRLTRLPASAPRPAPSPRAAVPTPGSSPATPSTPAPPPGRRLSAVWRSLVPLAPALLVDAPVLAHVHVPVVQPLAALYLVIGLPAFLIWQRVDWAGARSGGRRLAAAALPETVLYSVVTALGALIVLGLLLDVTLPVVGVERPLDPAPVALAVTGVLLVALVGRARRRPAASTGPPARRTRTPLTRREQVVVVLGPVCTALSAMGAVRLNNGADGTVTAAMLVLAALTFALAITWRFRLRLTVSLVAIYFVALAMLLMTSLRGWDLTGHDVQREYYVFALTQHFGAWDIRRFDDAYNACLSITILPTLFTGLTGLSGVYVFKVVFQVLFALCPVLVFLIARRFGSSLVALLSALYFVAFPTFFTDMPFLCRQEIGFLFLGATLLVATDNRWTRRRRIGWVLLFSVGTVLSHYSTTYILVALVAFALLGRSVFWGFSLLHDRLRPDAPVGRPLPEDTLVLGGAVLAGLLAMTVLWTGPVTHTGDQLQRTASGLVTSLLGGPAERSTDVSYSLFAPPPPPPAQRLADYEKGLLATTQAERAAGRYYPADVLARHPVVLAPPDDLPLTVAGRALARLGIDVELVNAVTRQGAAYLLQVLTCLGLFAVTLGRRAPGWRPRYEVYLLAIATFAVVAMQVVLPSLSVEYGVLRTFQQGLFLLAPFLAAGSVALFSWLGGVWGRRLAIGTALAFFLSLVGLVPQALGGYCAQLHLNNSGQYYQLYTIDPQEAAAADWLRDRLLRRGGGEIQLSAPDNRYTFDLRYNYPDAIAVSDIYPALLRPWGYVLLTRTTEVDHLSTSAVNGDKLDYVYPLELLDETKDVLYSSGTVAVYR